MIVETSSIRSATTNIRAAKNAMTMVRVPMIVFCFDVFCFTCNIFSAPITLANKASTNRNESDITLLPNLNAIKLRKKSVAPDVIRDLACPSFAYKKPVAVNAKIVNKVSTIEMFDNGIGLMIIFTIISIKADPRINTLR